MKDNSKMRMGIGFGVIAGSMIVAGAAFYYFSGIIQTQADHVVAEKAAEESEAGAVANLAALESDAPKAEEYSAAIDKLLPDQPGLIKFNTWVQQVGAKYGVTASISYKGDPVASSGAIPGNTEFSMTAQGPENSIPSFLDGLSKTPGFIVSFTSLDITNDPSQESLMADGISYFR